MARLALLLLLLSPAYGQEQAALENAERSATALAQTLTARKKEPKPPVHAARVSISLPLYGISVIRMGEAFSRAGSALTEPERALANKYLGDAVDLDSVRVVYAPSPISAPMTWGDVIRVPPGYAFTGSSVIHELVHVWQYQTRGTEYLSNSFLHQACAWLKTGDREKAYDYVLTEGKSLLDYTAEQQAQILEDYVDHPKRRVDPLVSALVAELKGIKALKGHALVFEERDAGLAPRDQALPALSGWEVPRDGEIGRVPQFEIRF